MKTKTVFVAVSLAFATFAPACGKAPSGGDPGPSPAAGSGGRRGAGGSTPSSTGGAPVSGTGGATPSGSGGVTTGTGGSPPSGTGGQSGDPDAGTPETGTETAAPPPVDRGELGAPNFPGWKYTRSIKMDTSPTGAGVTGPVTNYPVAVILNAQNFDFGQARPQGQDIRFGKADGTPIAAYSIEHFDSAGKTAAFWVKIDEVAGNNATQSFNMYWGNPAAGDASNSKLVFDPKDGFVAVWHLDEDGASNPDAFKDATGGGFDATGVNLTAGARVDARVGKGTRVANPKEQWLKVEGPKAATFNPTARMTVSLWGKADAYLSKSGPGGYDTIFSKGEAWTVQRIGTRQVWETCFSHVCAMSGSRPVPTGQWHHFVLVVNGGQRFYVNGANYSNASAGTRGNDKPLGIGNQTQYLGRPTEKRSWDGILDEARFMNVAKDDAWIKLEYESQKEGSTFLKFGDPQAR